MNITTTVLALALEYKGLADPMGKFRVWCVNKM